MTQGGFRQLPIFTPQERRRLLREASETLGHAAERVRVGWQAAHEAMEIGDPMPPSVNTAPAPAKRHEEFGPKAGVTGKEPVIGMVFSSYAPSNEPYVRAIEAAGGVVLPIPVRLDARQLHRIYSGCDGILFLGGPDIQPALYGEPPSPLARLDHPAAGRDGVEPLLVEWALQDNKPFLGICRGLQMLNVTTGGTLYQDVQDEGATLNDHRMEPGQGHNVVIRPGSVLHDVVGAHTTKTNSHHHQAIKDVGDGLIVTARAIDGIVEGVEVENHPYGVAVQFHPETLVFATPWASKLFRSFTEAATLGVQHKTTRHPASRPVPTTPLFGTPPVELPYRQAGRTQGGASLG